MASTGEAQRLTVNGEPHALPAPASIRELLRGLEIEGRVAVAVNREVVPRSEFERRHVGDGDRIEILEAVGGG